MLSEPAFTSAVWRCCECGLTLQRFHGASLHLGWCPQCEVRGFQVKRWLAGVLVEENGFIGFNPLFVFEENQVPPNTGLAAFSWKAVHVSYGIGDIVAVLVDGLAKKARIHALPHALNKTFQLHMVEAVGVLPTGETRYSLPENLRGLWPSWEAGRERAGAIVRKATKDGTEKEAIFVD